MNLHSLKLFYSVGLYGSVTAAAKELNISQPAVTAQIKNLENDYQVPLIIPKGRGIELTSIGKKVFEEAALLFEQADKIEKLLEIYSVTEHAELKIAGNYASMNYFMPEWIQQLQDKIPELKITAATLNTDQAVTDLLANKVDAIVVGSGGEKFSKEVNFVPIAKDELWFVSSPNHPLAEQKVSIQEAVQWPFVLREKGSYTRQVLEEVCQKAQVEFPVATMSFNGVHEALNSAIAGNGIYLCSAIVAKSSVAKRDLARIYLDDISPETTILVGTRPHEKMNFAVTELLSLVNRGKE